MVLEKCWLIGFGYRYGVAHGLEMWFWRSGGLLVNGYWDIVPHWVWKCDGSGVLDTLWFTAFGDGVAQWFSRTGPCMQIRSFVKDFTSPTV